MCSFLKETIDNNFLYVGHYEAFNSVHGGCLNIHLSCIHSAVNTPKCPL